jgi:hypothetical protein
LKTNQELNLETKKGFQKLSYLYLILRLRDAQFGFESSIERPSLGVLTDKESQYGSNRPTSDAMSGIFAESGLPFNASVQGTLDNVGLQGPPSPGNSIQNGGVSRPITPLGDTGN